MPGFDEAVPKLLLLGGPEPPASVSPSRRLLCPFSRLDAARDTVARLRIITSVVIPDTSFLRNPEHRELYCQAPARDGRGWRSASVLSRPNIRLNAPQSRAPKLTVERLALRESTDPAYRVSGGKNRRNPIELDPFWRTCFGYVVVPKQCTRTYVHEYSISWLDVNIPSYRSVCLGRKLLIGTPQRCDGLPYGWVWRYASFQFSQGTALGLRYAGICSPLLRSRTGSSAPSALVRNCVTRFETKLIPAS